MKKQLLRRSAGFFVLLLCFLAATACSPSVVISITENPPDPASFATEMSPAAEKLVRQLSGLGSDSGDGAESVQIFDADGITASLAYAGITVKSVSYPSDSGISLSLTVPDLNGFLDNAIILDRKNRKLILSLTRESLNSAAALMPEDTYDYLDLFMAPAFTGEDMTVSEYRDIIAAAYGRTLADEMEKEAFSLTVRCPSAPKEISVTPPGTGRVSGKDALITLPLAVLLVLENPVYIEVAW
ncbi:hypothetical protein K7I13_10495 [Brucepastera parasyntrophica]|uniref:hypothetical protein n=1 Tax=Brucepastera parasyntrophica TaxID=2880008 RepID=UPI002109D0DE|nr:hypothetical protein [Brucepastera parasyntrophica]ULQ58946.1 hypothetical protein K7I13_10495 [Brucepastera parasyntrophica]